MLWWSSCRTCTQNDVFCSRKKVITVKVFRIWIWQNQSCFMVSTTLSEFFSDFFFHKRNPLTFSMDIYIYIYEIRLAYSTSVQNGYLQTFSLIKWYGKIITV